MTESTRSVTVLGSTGSVGTQTVDLLAAAPERFHVRALVAGRNVGLLAEQAVALRAERAVIADPASYAQLRDALAGTRIEVAAGPEAVVAAAALPADLTMAAITGAAGLAATLAAIRRGAIVALANKEALVCAGEVMLRAVRDAGATLLPVDSEHNAIFQALADGNRDAVEKIVLTTSGGPFRTLSVEEMANATPEAALRHPVWSMGAKISIDSATMMNKCLEVIEAARLFALRRDADRRAGPSAGGDPWSGVLPGRQRAGPAWLARHAYPDRPHAGVAVAHGDAIAAPRPCRVGPAGLRRTGQRPISGTSSRARSAARRRRSVGDPQRGQRDSS